MTDVTRILSEIEQDAPSAAEQLLPLVYEELRRLAARKMSQEKPGQTLQTTALVHEAYIRLVDTQKSQHWTSRAHFFGAAAEAMRRILVDNARRKGRPKHGGERGRVSLDGLFPSTSAAPVDLLAMDEALTNLAEESPENARLVQLRYFAGCTLEQAAEMLNISLATAKRRWAYARAFLYDALSDGE